MNPKSSKRLVLLDAHAIIHRAYHALPEFSNSKGEPTGGLYGVSTMLIRLIGDLKPDFLVAAFDLPGATHRHTAYEGYKASRPKAEEALVSQLKRSRDIFAAFGIPIYDSPGFEADDILGTIVKKIQDSGFKIQDGKMKGGLIDVVIASGDMDTLQLVSNEKIRVFTLRKGITDTVIYDEKKVLERYGFGPERIPDYKGLSGDPSDNIPGVQGIGEKTATDLIKNFGSIEEIYKALKKDKKKFEEAGVKPRVVKILDENREEAEFSKVLATIRTDAPIEFSLPDKTWGESVSAEAVRKIFSELEFRTLGARFEEALKKLSGGNGETSSEKQEEGAPPFGAPKGGAGPDLFSSGSILSEEEVAELGVMVWLLDSNKTAPAEAEIFEFTKVKSVSDARVILEKQLAEKKLTRVFQEIEKPLIPVIAAMNRRGVLIDKKYFEVLSVDLGEELGKLEKDIWKQAGGEFNIASPKQLGEVLFQKLQLAGKRQKKTPTGALSTKESELLKMKDAHPVIPLILKHRELSKILGTYVDPLPALADSENRLHTTFLQAGTTTGRLSSRDPNLQNIPNNADFGRKIRKGFLASKGMKLLAFDYSQIELRIAAFLAADKKLIEIFKEGADVHSAVASQIFNVAPADVTKEMRRQAKVINFGVMYGMGVNALRQNLEAGAAEGVRVPREEAEKFYTNYFNTFSGLASYIQEIKEKAAARGFTETYFGRRRYFEGLNSRIPYVRAAAERMAINAPIQGTEADIIKLAMVRVDEFLKKEKLSEDVFLLLQVHDELVYEADEKCIAKIAPKIKEIMENVLPISETLGVPIVADISAGDNWGEMEKMKS